MFFLRYFTQQFPQYFLMNTYMGFKWAVLFLFTIYIYNFSKNLVGIV